MKYKNKNKNKTKQSKKKTAKKNNKRTNKQKRGTKQNKRNTKKTNANEHIMWIFLVPMNRIGDGMDSVLASRVIDRGFEPLSGQTKDYKIGICCFSAKHARIIKDKEQILFGM